jgi:hypothetical protein
MEAVVIRATRLPDQAPCAACGRFFMPVARRAFMKIPHKPYRQQAVITTVQ